MGTKESIAKLLAVAVLGVVQPVSKGETFGESLANAPSHLPFQEGFRITQLPASVELSDLERFPAIQDELRIRKFLEVISPEHRRVTLMELLDKESVDDLSRDERSILLEIANDLREKLGTSDPPAPG